MPLFRRLMGSLKVELNPEHEVLDLRNESRPPNCGHILSSSPICGHCLDGCRRALWLEQEWSSLTHAEGWEKWGKETLEQFGRFWRKLSWLRVAPAGVAGTLCLPKSLQSSGGSRLLMKSQVPGHNPSQADPGSAVPLVTGHEQVMGSEEPGPRPWTGRRLWVGRRWRWNSRAQHPRGNMGTQASENLDTQPLGSHTWSHSCLSVLVRTSWGPGSSEPRSRTWAQVDEEGGARRLTSLGCLPRASKCSLQM